MSSFFVIKKMLKVCFFLSYLVWFLHDCLINVCSFVIIYENLCFWFSE